jgi:hypothetical protein
VVDKISFALKEKLYCTITFLNVSQAFDRVWQASLFYKLKHLLPSHNCLILKSYLEYRFFSVFIGSTISLPAGINAGIPQDANTAPLHFNLFISDQPNSNQTLVGTFADDKAVIANSADSNLASLYVQNHLHLLKTWYREWEIKTSLPDVLLLCSMAHSRHYASIIRPYLIPNVYNILEFTSITDLLGHHTSKTKLSHLITAFVFYDPC